MPSSWFRLRFLLIPLLLFAYMNCSGPAFNVKSAYQESASLASNSGDEITAIEGSTITAYQDRNLRVLLPAAGTGATFSISGLPAWATLDQNTGEVRGVPPSPGTFTNINVTIIRNGSTSSAGPYTVNVIGDPLKEQQWGLENTGQLSFAGLAGKAGEDMRMIETVRQGIVGQGITVAVSDSGVEETHRGLAGNFLSGASRNYLLNYDVSQSWQGSSSPDNRDAENAHGTSVAGIIAETGWDGYGGRGVAPGAKFAGFLYIQAQSSLSSKGHSTTGLLDQFAGNFDIFNYSWGDSQCAFYQYSDISLAQKMKAGVTNLRGGKGAIYIKAAGNQYWDYLDNCYEGVSQTAYFLGNANFSEEATTPYTILVGAVNADGTITSYSTPGANVWVSAPGGETGYNKAQNATVVAQKPAIVTTDFSGCGKGLKSFSGTQSDFNRGQDPNTSCEHVSTMNGTSSAAPMVSGAAALILSANPALTWREVKHILASTADKVDSSRGSSTHPTSSGNLSGHTYEQGWVTNAAGYSFHNWYGFGRVNVDKAVSMAKTTNLGWSALSETNSGSTWTHDSGNINLSVPAGSATGVTHSLTVSKNLFTEAVQVRVTATNCIGSLGIELTSPSGTKNIIMNINSYLLESKINSHIFLSNAFYGEPSAGVWKMKMIGAKSGCETKWNSWQINVMGH